MSKNVLKIIGIFILGMGGGIFADQILWPYFIERPLFYQYRLEQSPVYVTEIKEVTIQENTALKNAAEKAEKIVAAVKTETAKGKILEGSGFIVSSDGLLVTLADLVPQGSEFSFFIEGSAVAFQILKRDLENNLALVKVGETNLPTAGFANLDKLKLGEKVFLIGAVSEGKIIKNIVNEGVIRSFDENYLRTNIFEEVPLQGSPLFNIEGEVLGMSIIDESGGVSAVPVSLIKSFVGF